jgi:hypothetical protein
MRSWSGLLFSLALSSSLARAGNLLTNGDFDSGLTGWNTFIYTTNLDSTIGSPSAPSVQISTSPFANSPGGNFNIWSECVSLTDVPQPWEYGMRVLVVSTGASCQLYVWASFDTGTCDTQGTNYGAETFAVGTVPGVGGDFTQYAATTNDPRPGGGASQVVRMMADGICYALGDAMTVNFDHAYIGTAGTTLVRLQSFGVD